MTGLSDLAKKIPIDGKEVTRNLFRMNAKGLLKGVIKERVESKTTAQIYDYLLNLDLWGGMPPNVEQFLVSFAPWDLDWLTLDWVYHVIYSSNKVAASSIITSPQLQQKIKENIAVVREHLCQEQNPQSTTAP